MLSTAVFGQRYGVVDTDYILKSLPEYAQAKSQLDKLSEQWAGEVSALQSELESLKDALDAERILLSPEKLEKREEGIEAKQAEVIALQQKYFGPEGQLFEKRNQLVQPIQDKVFGAVQAVAGKRKLEQIEARRCGCLSCVRLHITRRSGSYHGTNCIDQRNPLPESSSRPHLPNGSGIRSHKDNPCPK